MDFTKNQITLTRGDFRNIASSVASHIGKEFAEKDHELGVMTTIIAIKFGCDLEEALFDGGQDVKD